MRKKLLAVLMCTAIAVGMLAGCGNNTSDRDDGSDNTGVDNVEGSEQAESEESVELKMCMVSFGMNLEDAEKVQDAINEYINPLIGATVSIEWIGMGDWDNQLNLKLSSGEQIDVLPIWGTAISSMYGKDALAPLDSLMSAYGQGIVDAVGEDYLKAGYINGQLYAIPCAGNFALAEYFVYRKDIAEKYGLDFSGVTTLEDLEPILAKLQEQDPNMIGMISSNPSDSMLHNYAWDGLGDEYGVLMNPAESLEVSNLYETEEYKEMLTLMNDWYKKGYIQSDAATSADNIKTLLGAGNAFGVCYYYGPGEIERDAASCGYELESVRLTNPLSTTNVVTNSVMTIPTTAAYPEKAMEFMNLLYTDSTLHNYLSFGIEGEHYQIIDEENNVASYVEGEDMNSCKYVQMFRQPNKLIGLLWDSDPVTLWDDMVANNNNALKSKALGFSYDSSKVKNELSALDTITAKYRRGLECGSLDPETELPKFIQELKNAGIDTVVQEKQEQLDAWAKE